MTFHFLSKSRFNDLKVVTVCYLKLKWRQPDVLGVVETRLPTDARSVALLLTPATQVDIRPAPSLGWAQEEVQRQSHGQRASDPGGREPCAFRLVICSL